MLSFSHPVSVISIIILLDAIYGVSSVLDYTCHLIRGCVKEALNRNNTLESGKKFCSSRKRRNNVFI